MLHPVPLHIRVSRETRQRLGRLRSERHLNVGSWLRALIEEALDREFGPAFSDADEPSSPVETAPADPLPGWVPSRVEGNVWGARFQGEARSLPAKLEGLAITVTARNGNRWRATVTGVVERSADRVLVHTRRIEA